MKYPLLFLTVTASIFCLTSCSSENKTEAPAPPKYELTDLDKMFDGACKEVEGLMMNQSNGASSGQMFTWKSEQPKDMERPIINMYPAMSYVDTKDVSLFIKRRKSPDDGTFLMYALVRCNNVGRSGYTYHIEVVEYTLHNKILKKDRAYVFSNSQMRHALQPFFDRLDEALSQEKVIVPQRKLDDIKKLAVNG